MRATTGPGARSGGRRAVAAVLRVAGTMGVMGVAAAGLGAAAWPDRPVTVVIPFTSAGETDFATRIQQDYFARYAGQPMVIENWPGDGGAFAWSRLDSLPADGRVAMAVTLPQLVLLPRGTGVPAAIGRIRPVYFYHYTPDAVLVAADSPYRSLADLIEAARQAPGSVRLAGTGTGAGNHLFHQRLGSLLGIRTVYVPQPSTAAAIQAVLDGQVAGAVLYGSVGVQWRTQVRTLAVAAGERLPVLPDTPTFRELGFEAVGGAYRGLALPAATPEDIRQRFAAILAAINTDRQFALRMGDHGFVLIDIGPEEMPEFMAAQTAMIESLGHFLGSAEKLAEEPR